MAESGVTSSHDLVKLRKALECVKLSVQIDLLWKSAKKLNFGSRSAEAKTRHHIQVQGLYQSTSY